MIAPSSSPRPQNDMTEPLPHIKERRMSPPAEDSLARMGVNQDRLADGFDSYKVCIQSIQAELAAHRNTTAQQYDALVARADEHSARLADQNGIIALAQQTMGVIAKNVAEEAKARRQQESRSVDRHERMLGLTTEIQAAMATQHTTLLALNGEVIRLATHHEEDAEKARVALEGHVKREGILVRAGLMTPAIFAVIGAVVWYLFGPTIRKVIDAVVKLAIGP
jgi:hypothetical protein